MKCPKCNFDNPSDSKFCKECGTQLLPSKEIPVTETLETPTEELTAGSTFAGRYQIIEELGKGGMGKVYKVHDTEIKEKVALKLIKPEISADKKTIERFQNELKFARKISHRNVCRMYDLNKEEGSYYITMEYVSGEDLKSFIRRVGQLPVDKAISIAKQTCEGLSEAHRLGVVHRDLKPSNIMIDKEGNARIMDFGIARSLEAKRVTEAGMMIGTPEYMSPEQVEGEEVDQRSDIYSLGVMLFEMFTGQVPFEGKTPISVAMKHKSETPKNPREINTQIPEDLSYLILRCMEKEREKRYQTGEEVLSYLNKIEKNIPTQERVLEKLSISFQPFFNTLKKRKIFEMLAAFIGGGWLVLELVHWILIDHYHFPEETLDITFITILGALLCTLIWRFLGGIERKIRRLKVEFIIIPLIILATAFFDVRISLHIAKTPQTRAYKPEQVIETRSKNSVAVMYFKNNTGDASYDIWKKALCESIIIDLSQSRYVRVLPGDRLYSIMRKLKLLETVDYATEDLRQVAAEGGVAQILQGSLTKAGDTFRVDYTLGEIGTGEILGSGRIEGRGEESLFVMVDELTWKIKANFNLSAEEIASDIDRSVGNITTNSPEAFRNYVEGKKLANKGEYSESIPFLEKAVSLDPEFAMAYRTLGVIYSNQGYWEKMREYYKKAFRLSDRLSLRERYQIQGNYYRMTWRTYDKAIEALNRLLEIYPDDIIGNSMLGSLYGETEEWDKAIERYEVNIKNKEYRGTASYTSAATNYAAKGIYNRATGVLEFYLNNISDNYYIRQNLARIYLAQGKFDMSLIEVNKAIFQYSKSYKNFYLKGIIYHCLDDFAQAEQEYKKLLEHEEQISQSDARDILGSLYLSEGRYEEAKNQARKSIELAEELGEKEWLSVAHNNLTCMHISSGHFNQALKECDIALSIGREVDHLGLQICDLHSKGWILIKMKSFHDAERVANELRDLIKEGMNRKEIRNYYDLNGRLELERGNFSQAIEHFRKAISLLGYQNGYFTDHALMFEPLALAYFKSGDLEKAEEQYKKIISLTTGRIVYGDIYAKSFYMLGKIYEEQGTIAKAIEHYEKFLDLWKDADPGIPEVADARKRLAGLKE